MSRKSRRKMVKDLSDFLYSLVILLTVYVWFRTGNYKLAIAAFISGVVVIVLIIKRIKYQKMKKLINSGINIVDKMTGEDFEEFLLAHFNNLGYRGDTTSLSHDYGADLVLGKDGEKIVIQAKRWTSKVGIEAVQQITAAIKYYNANRGFVITNNYFTKNAFELAKVNQIELWDRTKLINIMNNSNGKEIANNVINHNQCIIENNNIEENKKGKICPKCKSELILRHGKHGQFYGCSSFPKCKYTENI